MSKDSPSSRTGRNWATGGNAPFRDDLVAWPTPPSTREKEISEMSVDELRDELEQSRDEIRRLEGRVKMLAEENEALRSKK